MDFEKIKHFLRSNRKRIIITLLVLAPAILAMLGISPTSPFAPLNTYYFKSSYVYYPTIYIMVLVFGIPFASPTNLPEWYQHVASVFSIIVTPLIWYALVCVVLSIWEKTFARLFGKRTAFFQVVALVILFSVFVYKTSILPGVEQSRVSLKINTPSEIDINKEYRLVYNSGGEEISQIRLQEIIIRNNSDYETPYKVPGNLNICLHDIQSGVAEGYIAPLVDEEGNYIKWEDQHQNLIILDPHSEIKIYREGFRDLLHNAGSPFANYRDDFDEFLLIGGFSYSSSEFCRALTAEQIAGAERIKILR